MTARGPTSPARSRDGGRAPASYAIGRRRARETAPLLALHGQPTDARKWTGRCRGSPRCAPPVRRAGGCCRCPPRASDNPSGASTASSRRQGGRDLHPRGLRRAAREAVESDRHLNSSSRSRRSRSPHLVEILSRPNECSPRTRGLCDGPSTIGSQAGRLACAGTNVELTVYGPKPSAAPLRHWAEPAMLLRACWLDEGVRARDHRLYATPSLWVRQTARAPRPRLRQECVRSRVKLPGRGRPLLELINEPSLNSLAGERGDGALARNVIPTTAVAALDLLCFTATPRRQSSGSSRTSRARLPRHRYDRPTKRDCAPAVAKVIVSPALHAERTRWTFPSRAPSSGRTDGAEEESPHAHARRAPPSRSSRDLVAPPSRPVANTTTTTRQNETYSSNLWGIETYSA